MNSLPKENFLKTAIKWLIFIALLTPLWVSSSTLFPYVFGKQIALQILVELMLICYIWLLYYNCQRTGQMEYLPKLYFKQTANNSKQPNAASKKKNLLFWALLAFLAILILNNIFSVDPSYSFWSKQERMDGLFNLFHFFAFFFILSAIIKDKKSWLQILNVSVIVSFIIGLHALGQHLGWFFRPYGERVTGPLGNASFLATYLLFNIFFAVFLFAQNKKISRRLWYSAVILLSVIILLFTSTRGAMLGLAGGFLILLLGYIFLAPASKFKKYPLAIAIIFLILAAFLLIGRNSNFVKNNEILSRFTDISLKSGTAKARIASWKIGLSAFYQRPIFGWGEENYYVAFNKHLDPYFFSVSGETFDRAHNKIVDLLVMNGILGLLAYLFVFLAALIHLWQQRKKELINSLILISILAAYFIQNLFLFDMPVAYLMFFLLLGLINFSIQNNPQETKNITDKTNPRQKKNNPALINYLALPLTIVLIVFIWLGNLKPLFASQASIEAQIILSSQGANDAQVKLSMEKFKESLEANTFTNPETLKFMPQLVLNINASPQFSQQVKFNALEFTAEQIEKGIEKMPLFFDHYTNLTDIYDALSAYDSSTLSKGETVMKKIIDTYPNIPYIYYKLVINRLLAGQNQQAIDIANRALQLNPRLSQSNWYLGLAYFYSQDYAQAKEYTEKAINLSYNYNNPSSLYYLTQLYGNLKDYKKSIYYYQLLIKLAPNDFQIQFELAKAYKLDGQTAMARDLAEKLLSSSAPDTASTVKEFINTLK